MRRLPRLCVRIREDPILSIASRRRGVDCGFRSSPRTAPRNFRRAASGRRPGAGMRLSAASAPATAAGGRIPRDEGGQGQSRCLVVLSSCRPWPFAGGGLPPNPALRRKGASPCGNPPNCTEFYVRYMLIIKEIFRVNSAGARRAAAPYRGRPWSHCDLPGGGGVRSGRARPPGTPQEEVVVPLRPAGRRRRALR